MTEFHFGIASLTRHLLKVTFLGNIEQVDCKIVREIHKRTVIFILFTWKGIDATRSPAAFLSLAVLRFNGTESQGLSEANVQKHMFLQNHLNPTLHSSLN